MKRKCCHKTIWLQLRKEWQQFWSNFGLAENDHLFLGPIGTVNSPELCNIILAHQEVTSDKANNKWQAGKTSLFMVIYVKFMKWRKGEDKKKKIEATSQGKQSISQHSKRTKQGNIKKYIERGNRGEFSLQHTHCSTYSCRGNDGFKINGRISRDFPHLFLTGCKQLSQARKSEGGEGVWCAH